MFSRLICSMWEEGKVPKDWADAVLVPIPKKVDLRCCNNWMGIALLDVVGKIVASYRIPQERLQLLPDKVLTTSESMWFQKV